jgi:hypothetical protein|nr:MAG: NinG protein [Bacteriophage sp.]
MKKQNNDYRNQVLRGLKRKYESILSRGGKCEKCGYDKNISALEFHHKNPEEKDFQLDIRKFSNSNLDSLQKELDKCELLCANCHRELHHPDLDISNIKELLEEGKYKTSFSNKKEFGDVCPICGKRFKKSKGKLYCSEECRFKSKNYPEKETLLKKLHDFSGNYRKVAEFFKLTRKIITNLVKRYNLKEEVDKIRKTNQNKEDK